MTGSADAIPWKGKICAVIVTYNPSIEKFPLSVASIAAQVDFIVLVDNASGNNFHCPDAIQNIEVIGLSRNLGVAAAHNIGIAFAIKHKFKYVLLFDQDSLPAPNMVRGLLDAHDALSSRGNKVSAVGPVFKDPITNNAASFIRLGCLKFRQVGPQDTSCYIAADFLISSGSLISMEAFNDIGPMDESLFIDQVDTEWFLRARAKGYQAFGVPEAVMYHSLGDKTVKIWFGRWRHIPQHRPIRHYYMFRNSILLYKRGYMPLRWKLNDVIKLIYLLVFSMSLMPERTLRLAMIARGILDGLRGRTGECD